MPSFDLNKDVINGSDYGDMYLFKQHFDRDELFNKLETYYNGDGYRFGIPEDDLSTVDNILEKFCYELEIVQEIEEHCVVAERQSRMESLLKNSILSQRRGNHRVFVMRDELSVRQAVEHGAQPIEKTGVHVVEIEWKIQ